MITLDAGVLIAHLWPADRHHPSATSLLRESAGEQLIIHELNLAEVLIGGVRVDRAEEMLADLEAMGVRVADRRAGGALRLATLRTGSRLRLPDCCALDTALANSSRLATFDDALADVARRHRVEVLPPSRT